MLVADAFDGSPLDWHAVDVGDWRRAARRHRPARRDRRVAGRHPRSRDLQRHAERPLLGVRGRPDELRRRLAPRRPTWRRCSSASSRSSTATTGSCCRATCRSARSRTCAACASRPCSASRSGSSRLGADEDWQRRFSLFTLDRTDGGAPDVAGGLVLLPTSPAVLQGEPLEQVVLIRDEMANMVWGVERVVPLADGGGVRGVEAARETRAAYQRLLAGTTPPAAPPPAAPIRYQAMTSVPENWIPFVPAHVDGDNRETQLQRAAMPRLLDGDPNPPVPVRPRTSLLRAGPRREPARAVPRARGGGAARGHPGRAGLPARPLARRAGRRVVRGAARGRARRGIERAGVRPDGAERPAVIHTHSLRWSRRVTI